MTVELLSAIVIVSVIGLPILGYGLFLCYALIKTVLTIPTYGDRRLDEVDGMYVQIDGQVRVDD